MDEGPQCRGQYAEAHEKQHAIEPVQNDDAADEKDHVADPRQRDLGRHALNLSDVGVEPCGDLSHGHVGVEARRQALKLPEQPQPHVEQDLGGRPRIDEPTDDVQREAADA